MLHVHCSVQLRTGRLSKMTSPHTSRVQGLQEFSFFYFVSLTKKKDNNCASDTAKSFETHTHTQKMAGKHLMEIIGFEEKLRGVWKHVFPTAVFCLHCSDSSSLLRCGEKNLKINLVGEFFFFCLFFKGDMWLQAALNYVSKWMAIKLQVKHWPGLQYSRLSTNRFLHTAERRERQSRDRPLIFLQAER